MTAAQNNLGVRNWRTIYQRVKRLRNIELRTGASAAVYRTHWQLIFPDGQKMFFDLDTVDLEELERSANTWLTIISNRV